MPLSRVALQHFSVARPHKITQVILLLCLPRLMNRFILDRLLILLATLLLVDCGTPGPPLPPSLELPKPVTNLRAARKGDHVFLTWTVPSKTTEHANIRYLDGTRVCRSLTTMTSCQNPVGEVARPTQQTRTSRNGPNLKSQASYMDRLPADL